MKGNTVLSGSEIKVQDRKIKLDERHLYLDCSLTQRQAESSPFLFRDLTELLDSGRLQDGNQENPMTVYLAPGVYWIAEPGDERICTAKPGDKLPYEKKVKCQWLFLEGLSQNPMDVVIAADKGQSHGCIGNYTMFHFEGDGLHLKNLTVGNYCNVDLVYPKDPSQNRKKRTSAVTQAQLGDVEGDCFFAENCRFISRLNLYPFCGAKRSLYDRCHFESTDDALNGNAVYLECDFDFYGGRPLACTQGAGCVFLDCLFRIRGIRAREEADQYFMKGQGTVYLIRCRFVDERDWKEPASKEGRRLSVEWTRYPEASLKCYEYENSFEGVPLCVGTPGKDTVSLKGKDALKAFPIQNLLGGEDGWNPKGQLFPEKEERIPIKLMLDTKEVTLEKGQEAYLEAFEVFFDGTKRKARDVTFRLSGSVAEIRPEGENSCVITGSNNHKTEQRAVLTALTKQGLEAAALIMARPARTQPPAWEQMPWIKYDKGVFRLQYSFRDKEEKDYSLVEWYVRRDGEEILVRESSQGAGDLGYTPVDDDIGGRLLVRVTPKSSSSGYGEPVTAAAQQVITWEQIPKHGHLETDFTAFPKVCQPRLQKGRWINDFYEPVEKGELKEWRKWVTELPSAPWGYGELGNGCKGKGLYPLVQGVKLMYAFRERCSNMRLELVLDPAKTGGQGFGSAGQYLDVCVKLEETLLSGYGLRVMRTARAADAVAAFLVKYEGGIARPISEKVYTSCFITGCHILLEARGEVLMAEMFTEREIPPGKAWERQVRLEEKISPDVRSGFGIFHTGTNGDGGWQNTIMLHRLTVDVTKDG